MNLRLRPRFELRVDLTVCDAQRRFDRVADSTPFDIHFDDGQVEMTVPGRKRHFWSPYLKLRIRSDEEGTVLRGRFGPNINVWSMFLAAYAVLGLTGSAGLFIAVSQRLLEQTPTGLLLAGVCLVLSLFVWSAGRFGRYLAYDQMVEIHRFVHETFADVIVDDAYCEACDGPSEIGG